MRQMVIAGMALVLMAFPILGQEPVNTTGRMMQQEDRLTTGGYGQIDYNQPVEGGTFQNGALDVHRLVLLFGYKFNDKTQFIMEDDIPSENIFAAGEIMSGNVLGKGYMAGFGMTIGTVFGRIAGKEAAKYAKNN